MCMCSEFVIQVLKVKQKNAHVSFPVGMVDMVQQGMRSHPLAMRTLRWASFAILMYAYVLSPHAGIPQKP